MHLNADLIDVPILHEIRIRTWYRVTENSVWSEELGFGVVRNQRHPECLQARGLVEKSEDKATVVRE